MISKILLALGAMKPLLVKLIPVITNLLDWLCRAFPSRAERLKTLNRTRRETMSLPKKKRNLAKGVK